MIATDQAGNADLTQDQRVWTVDTLAPTVSIDRACTRHRSPDPTLTNSKTPSFTLSATEQAVTFECALDPPVPATPTFTPCNATYTTSTLADGPHSLNVRGKDAGGNLSPVATKSFTVDATAPEVQFDLTPAPISNATDATFQFSVKNDPDRHLHLPVQARHRADFTPCTSPKAYSGLPEGQRNLQVKATDTAGNTGPPTTFRWTIDTSLPQTQIGSRPRPVTNATTAVFDFQSPNTSPVTFQCNLDKKPTWTDCTTQPQTYTGLGEGNHTFEVKAINSAGTEDPTPATYSWNVDTADGGRAFFVLSVVRKFELARSCD